METSDASAKPAEFTFRRCVLLCLPALIVGAALRLSFLLAVPQVFYGSDSNSYFTTAHDLWVEHSFNLPAKRRFLYPLMEAVLPILPGSPAVWTSVIQHTVGLGTLIGIGWIVGQLTRRPSWWVPPVTLAAAIWPRMLWYEHEMIAESLVLAAYVAAVALALPLSRLRTSRGLLLFLIAVTTMIALKPHGRPFCLALMALAAIYCWRRVRLEVKHYVALGAMALVLLTGGSGSQGSWLLLSSALPLVKTEGAKYQGYRDCLRPLIEETRADLENYTTSQGKYKKLLNQRYELGPYWGQLVHDKELYAKVTKRLALEGILSHPFTYTGMVFRKLMLAMSSQSAGALLSPASFWKKQADSHEDRWDRRTAEMRLVYHMEEPEYRQAEARSAARTLWFQPWVFPVSRHTVWTTYRYRGPGVAPRIGITWLGVLSLIGLLTCFCPSRFWATAVVWFPPLFYYLAIFGVGDAVVRYLHPADWCWLVVIALGADFVCTQVQALFRRRQPAAA